MKIESYRGNIFLMVLIILLIGDCAIQRGNVPTDSKTGLPIEEYRRLEEKAAYDQSCRDTVVSSYRSSDYTMHADCHRRSGK
jgi:type IV pilus biogenesis protein CpaD/CtpE